MSRRTQSRRKPGVENSNSASAYICIDLDVHDIVGDCIYIDI